MKTVDIYTDGACSGNPGVGGYCAILMYNGAEKVVSGYELETTNNRMGSEPNRDLRAGRGRPHAGYGFHPRRDPYS